jgi:hypothetical protein
MLCHPFRCTSRIPVYSEPANFGVYWGRQIYPMKGIIQAGAYPTVEWKGTQESIGCLALRHHVLQREKLTELRRYGSVACQPSRSIQTKASKGNDAAGSSSAPSSLNKDVLFDTEVCGSWKIAQAGIFLVY